MTHETELYSKEFPKELKLILSMLRGDLTTLTSEEIVGRLRDVNWSLFVQLVNHHRLYSVIYVNLKRMNLPIVPEAVMERLKQQYTINTFRMLQLTAEMEQVCRAFRERGIRTITLKGPALAHDLYGDVSMRTSKDLDILIPVQEVEAAERILTELGYQRKEGERELTVRSWKWREHHICYIHPNKRTQVEIHWRLNPDSGRETDFELLWKRSRFSSYTQTPVRMLEREDLWVYLVTHGARHGWFRLRWLLDIDQMIRTIPMDMAKVERRLRAEGRLSIGSQALHLTSDLLHTPLNESCTSIMAIRERTGKRLAQEGTLFMNDMLASPAELKHYQSYLFSLRSTRQKWFFFVERLYPSIWDVHQLPLPRSLFFLYFPLRPFLWFWRRLKRSTMTERGKV
ncbi:nucleotidyltransferase domain-containing protein [Paenibacillus amylolyticus]|uniref:nucleotidyltransferase domain-containing protein n=1 Tax=Paenibacillus amylolyticus TaxID=1451 RepID=UPI003EC052B9